MENEFKRAVSRLQRNADHDELFDDGGASMAQEEQLIANTERLERTSRKLQDAYRVTVETEEACECLNWFYNRLGLGRFFRSSEPQPTT